ncbi:hypothetical protein ACIBCC_09905 [Streptomyces griseus]|uniref:hypothetical protein n=1 Tax=Streptomyces griseus TaxID=1911 RepID=UPI0037A5677A
MTSSDATRPSATVTRVLWLLIITLFSTLVATCVAALKYAAGAGVPDVILSAGTAFGAAAGLCFAALGTVAALRR